MGVCIQQGFHMRNTGARRTTTVLILSGVAGVAAAQVSLPIGTPGWNYGRENCNRHTEPAGSTDLPTCIACCDAALFNPLTPAEVKQCRNYCIVSWGPYND